MDAYRFYVPDLLPQSGEAFVRLPEDQAHHARVVLRLEAGAAVVVFDGAGHWAGGKLAAVGKHDVTVTLVGEVVTDPLPAVALTLATAIPKGERAEWLVEQASQLDVAAIQFLDTDRSVVKPKEGGGKVAKWRRLAAESAKQCGRTWLMEIREPVGLAGALEAARGETVVWLEPREGALSKAIGEVLAGGGGGGAVKMTALVGPEGGWSERERGLLEGLAESGAVTRVRLTRTVLRIETACAAVAALVNGSR
jgi:16S rRNA (uracil1498-N3)-methyltransferase